MASFDDGKAEVCTWIRSNVRPEETVLDVGACDGKWQKMLAEYRAMDAIDIYALNALQLANGGQYRDVYQGDIHAFKYAYYDLVILGDVLEHMTVERAQDVLRYAIGHARHVIVAVPFLYEQGPLYGNPWETHIQPDLTPKIYEERYPGYKAVIRARPGYSYYIYEGITTAESQG